MVTIVALALWVLPIWIAYKRNHPQKLAIFLLLLAAPFLYWIPPWIVAMIWSLRRPKISLQQRYNNIADEFKDMWTKV